MSMAEDLQQFVFRLREQLRRQCNDQTAAIRDEIARLTADLAALTDAEALAAEREQELAGLQQGCARLEDALAERWASLAQKRAARCTQARADISALLDECEALAADALLADAKELLGAHPDQFTPAALAPRLAQDRRPAEFRDRFRSALARAAEETAGMSRLRDEQADIAARCESLRREISDLKTALREAHRVDSALLNQFDGLNPWQLDEFAALVQTWQRRLEIELDWVIPVNIAGGLDDGH